jgi:hypothetical protein
MIFVKNTLYIGLELLYYFFMITGYSKIMLLTAAVISAAVAPWPLGWSHPISPAHRHLYFDTINPQTEESL